MVFDFEYVFVVFVEFVDGWVECDMNFFVSFVVGFFDCLEDDFDCFDVVVESWCEVVFVVGVC